MKIEPVVAECDLAELLAGITPDNIHHQVDFGEAVGKELLQ
ncbi:AbrB/MazE/SpoVT family DNA-binding domain-containing protein [Acetobacter lambici]|uniref:Transcriptional regulator n=1 Tax=Acetobacter lambici TaxID=1332824 RepID=A0ABT1F8K6_9PROT|nr:transcriptional regulator [Acetobacter lambici]MCP1244117.1 transcriptional regulator [Acetobacter lambici]MCP1260144.1 transcriptional regulator [Acetobacter lambici]